MPKPVRNSLLQQRPLLKAELLEDAQVTWTFKALAYPTSCPENKQRQTCSNPFLSIRVGTEWFAIAKHEMKHEPEEHG